MIAAHKGHNFVLDGLRAFAPTATVLSGIRMCAAAAALMMAVSACSGGAPSGPKGTSSSKDAVPPVFKGAVLSYSGTKGSLSLHWPLASDNVTSAGKLVYKVYAGTSADPGVLAQNANLKATVTNKSTATVYDLAPGAYYCLVKAVDEAGNQSLNTAVAAVSVLPADLVAVSTPKVLEKMNVSVSQSDANNAVLGGADAASIAPNDFVVISNPIGQSLKKVVSAKHAGGNVTVNLKDAGLGEVVRSGNIESSTLMASAAGLASQRSGGQIPGTANLQYKDAAGFFEIAEFGVSDDAGAKAAKDMAKFGEMAALDPGITLGYSILFEPELVTSARFDPARSANTLAAIRVTAKGTLNFNGKTLFELRDGAAHDVTRRVLNRTVSMKYPVGAVPVEQETNLEVMAHLQLNAGEPLNMFAELSTSKSVEIAFEWTREAGWRQVANDTFDQRITLNILSAGKIVGTLELFPIISTRFFNAAKTGSYKIPKLDVNADVRIIPPPLEVSAFDTGVHVDSYIPANPKVFGFTVAEWEKNQREIQNQKIAAQQPVVVAEAAKKGTVGTDVPLDVKASPASKPAAAPVVEAKKAPAPAAPAAPAAKPAPAPVVEAKAPAAPAQKAVAGAASGSASISFDDLAPSVVSTNEAPYKAVITASGSNLGNVTKITFDLVRVKNGAKGGTYVWTKKGKLRGRPWDSKVSLNSDGTLTMKPIITTPGDPARQTTWTITLSDKHGVTSSKSFVVDYAGGSASPTVAAVKPVQATPPVEKTEAKVTPPPAPKPAPAPKAEPVKTTPPVEKAEAVVTPPPAPKPAPAPKPEPVKATPPVEKAEAVVTPPPAPKPAPAPKPEPVKATTPVEKAEAVVTPPPAPKPAPAPKAEPVKAAPPVEKAQAPVTPPPPAPKPAPAPKPEPAKVTPPVEKAQAPVTPPPAPKPAPAPKPEPVKATPPVEKAQAPVTPPPAPKPAPAPAPAAAPVKSAPAVEKAAAVETASAPGISVPGLMGGAIQKPLAVTGAVSNVAGAAGAAGAADGSMASARFNYLHGITSDGGNLYITDQSNGTIRKVVIATGAVSTIAGTAGASGSADGTGAAARFYLPEGITTDGTNLYVADRNNNTIRKIVIATGAVSTLAGYPAIPGSADGTGQAARFDEPNGITTDGKNLYVTDKKNNAIRKIVIATGAVSTLAGKAGERGSVDGAGASARFTSPAGITTDGKNLYVADQYSYSIRKIVIATGAVSTLAGKNGVSGTADGTGTAALFSGPTGITTDGVNLYVTEPLKNTVRKVSIATGAVSTLSSSEGAAAAFKTPKGITSDGTYLYVADYGNQTVKKIK